MPPIAIAMGVAVGLAAAAAATHLLAAFLHGVAPRDPATFLLTTGIVLAVAATACWLPARLAGRLDPLAVLRAE
jgi:putative ABC transport system permease protein